MLEEVKLREAAIPILLSDPGFVEVDGYIYRTPASEDSLVDPKDYGHWANTIVANELERHVIAGLTSGSMPVKIAIKLTNEILGNKVVFNGCSFCRHPEGLWDGVSDRCECGNRRMMWMCNGDFTNMTISAVPA